MHILTSLTLNLGNGSVAAQPDGPGPWAGLDTKKSRKALLGPRPKRRTYFYDRA